MTKRKRTNNTMTKRKRTFWLLYCLPLSFFFWLLYCLPFYPFSFGHCIVCPFSFGNCIVFSFFAWTLHCYEKGQKEKQ
jgi:hypothetical protein